MVPAPLRAVAAARLHPEWRFLARRSWSFRLSILNIILSGIEVAMGVLTSNPPIDPMKFALLSGAVTVAAATTRLLSQPSMSGSVE